MESKCWLLLLKDLVLDSIIQQNNYTNTYLKTIGQKLQDIEDRLTPSSTSIKKENVYNIPLFIPHEITPLP